MKNRAHSAPSVPKLAEEGSHDDDDAADEDKDGEEIADDAFFQRYHFPQPVETKEEPSDSGVDSSSDTEGPLSPTHMQQRQATGDVPSEPSTGVSSAHTPCSVNDRVLTLRPQSANSDSTPAMQDINIAVIGAPSTGKSTFIRRALSLADTTAPSNCSRKWTIDGVPYMVRFVEVSIAHLHAGERNTVQWPETVHDVATPRIDGAVTIYDVTSQDSLAKVPEMLS